MRRVVPQLLVLSFLFCGGLPGQSSEARTGWRSELPEWLELNPEVRYRYEGRQGNAFEVDVEHGVLSRYFLGVGVRPHRRFRVYVQGMDARMPTINKDRLTERYRDVFDIREAYVELGDAEEDPLIVLAGRQIFSYGVERVIGRINWSNSRRAFDAVRVRHESDVARVDFFSGSVVEDYPDRLDRSDYGNGFHGVYSTWKKAVPGAEVDAYLLYRTRRTAVDELGRVGDGDLWAPGVRVGGMAGERFDYDAELVVERGSFGQSDLEAFSAAVEGGYVLAETGWKPRVFGLYQYASGDSDPTDGKIGTYDQIYASNHRHRGLVDVIGYRNLDNWALGIEGSPHERLRLKFQTDSYRLADRHDGYYTFNGRRRVAGVAGGAESKQIAFEYDFSAAVRLNSMTNLTAGVGRFARGDFLRRYSDINSSTFGYVAVEWTP